MALAGPVENHLVALHLNSTYDTDFLLLLPTRSQKAPNHNTPILLLPAFHLQHPTEETKSPVAADRAYTRRSHRNLGP